MVVFSLLEISSRPSGGSISKTRESLSTTGTISLANGISAVWVLPAAGQVNLVCQRDSQDVMCACAFQAYFLACLRGQHLDRSHQCGS